MTIIGFSPKKNLGHILIVDDELLNRTLLAANLRQSGHTVTLAADGNAALRYLQDASCDLILLDLLMPGMDGYEVLAKIKANSNWIHIPVIVISGLDDTASMVECIKLGAADYLHKPFDPVLLKARIEASLANKRLRDLEQQTQRQLASQKEILQKLVTVARTVAQSPALETTLENVIKVAISLTQADAATILIATGSGYFTPCFLDETERLVVSPVKIMKTVSEPALVEWVMLHQQSLIVNDTVEERRWLISSKQNDKDRSLLLTPILYREKTLGILTLTHSHPFFFDEEALVLIEAATDQMALAIRNAQRFENERKTTQQRTIVYEILREVGEHFEVDELAKTAVTLIKTHTDWPTILFLMPTVDERELIVKAVIGSDTYQAGHRLDINEDLIGTAFLKVQTVCQADETIMESLATDDQTLTHFNQIAVPLHHGSQMLGVLSITSTTPNAFDADDLQLAELLTNAISLALHNAKLYSDMRDYLADLSTLFTVSQIAGQSIVLQNVLDQALNAALSSLGFEAGLITLKNKDDSLELAASYNLPPGMAQSARVAGFGGSLCEYVHKRQQSLAIIDLNEILSPSIQDMAQSIKTYGYSAYAGTPLLHQERSLGTICLFAHTENLPTAITPALLEAIGSLVATAVANAHLHQAVAREHSQLQTLIDASHDGIALISQHQQILVVNTAALRLLNLPGTPSDWAKRPLRYALRLLKPHAPNVVKTALAEIKRNQKDNSHSGNGEYELGSSILQWQNSPVVIEGKLSGRLLVLRDVA